MRTFLAVIGALFLLFVLFVAGAFIFGWQRMGPLKKEATAFVDEALPAIISDWNGEALLENASPEFRAALTPDKLEELMMGGMSMFGPMTKYADAECKIVRVAMQSGEGESAEAECVAGASFARTETLVRTSAIKRGGAWKLFALYVEGGKDAPIQRTAHVKSDRLAVIEAAPADGFIAISAPSRDAHVGAGIGGVETVHVDR